MADTILTDSLTVQQWEEKFFGEYLQATQFSDVMGTEEGSIIRLQDKLLNSTGTIVHVGHIANLENAGVVGSATLEGNEEALSNYSFALRTMHYRKAVNILKSDTIRTNIDLIKAAEGALRKHFASRLRADIITSLQGFNLAGAANTDGTPGEDSFKTASAALTADKNAWMNANSDRVLYGASIGNASSGVHATALANVDKVNDKLTPAMVSLARRIAVNSGTAAGKNTIAPYQLKNGNEIYVMYVDSNGMRDLRNDSSMMQANRDARIRGEDNPIFQSGDLLWDGVVIKQVAQIPTLGAVGAGGTDKVGTAFLCGAGAASLAYSQMPQVKTQMKDYEFKHGIALEEVRSQTGLKTSFNGVQYGAVTVFHSSEGDA